VKKIVLNRKGQSLVEVTVALSILAIVLTGVVTLAVNTVGLMLASRSRMEGTAYAQQGLEILKAKPGSDCTTGLELNSPTDITLPVPSPYDSIYTRTYKVADPPSGTVPPSSHTLVSVKVTWEFRGQPGGEITVKQIMKRK